MVDKVLERGYAAIGLGALASGCELVPVCPTGPEDEFLDWLAEEFPKNGKQFVRTASETGAMNMAFGVSSAGGRTMVCVGSAGWGLIQETMSHCVNAYLPMVVMLTEKGGPGAGTLRHAQMDYYAVTRDAGQGNYRTITLAPASVQEAYEMSQLAFHLADKYRNPVIVAVDLLTMRMLESLEANPTEFEALPEKNWIVQGKTRNGSPMRRMIASGAGFNPTPQFPHYMSLLQGLADKFAQIQQNEVRYEGYQLEDADIVMVAYGYSARVCQQALVDARKEGLKVGLVRPITLWPFPSEVLAQKAKTGAKFLVVEDGLGGLDEDVKQAVGDKVKLATVSALDRDDPGEGGAIYPGKVLERLRDLV